MARKATKATTRTIIDFDLMIEIAAHAIGNQIAAILPGRGMSANVATFADTLHPETAPHKWLGVNRQYRDRFGYSERDRYYAALMSVDASILQPGTSAYINGMGGLKARGIQPGEYSDKLQDVGKPARVKVAKPAARKARKGTPKRTTTARKIAAPVAKDAPLTDAQLEQIATRVVELIVGRDK